MLWVVVAIPLPVAAESLRLIVDRQSDAVSLYFAIPAGLIPTVFAADAKGILEDDGTVDLAGLYEGTFDTGDEIFAGVEALIGDAPAGFEATSLMVHDPTILPPFQTPLDAEISIAICNAPAAVDQMGLDDLHAYAGFFAWQVDGAKTLTLRFPETGRDEIAVSVASFSDGGSIEWQNSRLADGGILVLDPPQPKRARWSLWVVGLMALGALAALRNQAALK